MDPDATLAAAREAYACTDYERAAELFDALDQWISRGGFLPEKWRRP